MILSVIFLLYLVVPSPDFPEPPHDALQSDEPADTETHLRRGYFTDYSREEVMEHYYKQLTKSERLKIRVQQFSYPLIYSPKFKKYVIELELLTKELL